MYLIVHVRIQRHISSGCVWRSEGKGRTEREREREGQREKEREGQREGGRNMEAGHTSNL